MNTDDEKEILDLFVKGNYCSAIDLYEQKLRQPGYWNLFDENNNLTKYGIETYLRQIQIVPTGNAHRMLSVWQQLIAGSVIRNTPAQNHPKQARAASPVNNQSRLDGGHELHRK